MNFFFSIPQANDLTGGDEMAFGRELPDDLTADVLRRLPPRNLAVSRCVCRWWRDLVDARRLLRADLLPRSVGGIFMHYCALYTPEFLARPTTGRRPSVSGSGALDQDRWGGGGGGGGRRRRRRRRIRPFTRAKSNASCTIPPCHRITRCSSSVPISSSSRC